MAAARCSSSALLQRAATAAARRLLWPAAALQHRHGRSIHSTSPKPPTPQEFVENPPRDLQDVKFVLEENGVGIITLERCVVRRAVVVATTCPD